MPEMPKPFGKAWKNLKVKSKQSMGNKVHYLSPIGFKYQLKQLSININ
jgi:hypothetical protein